MLVIRVSVYPDIPPTGGAGGFPPGSFDHLLQRGVRLPGLDPTWTHTLIDAQVTEDRSSAELTLRSAPLAPLSLDCSLRVVTWQPAAYARAHDSAGNILVETRLDAPLQPGQLVEVGGETYRVAPATHTEMWPHRDPVSGICRKSLDYQHVVLHPDPQAPHLPTEVPAS